MRLIMLSTGPFAVPTFRRLFLTCHDVVALGTAPVRVRRGKAVATPSALREIAAEHGTPIFDPESINTDEARSRLRELQADLLVVCDYGQILTADTLAVARLGGINLHGSLLPKYRGAAPINWAVYHGETTTGVTVIHMTPKIDAGPRIARAETAIGVDETAEQLEPRLAEMGAPLVCKAIDALDAGRAEPLPQDASLASKAPRLKKADGAVDWSRPAVAIRNQVRAFEPWPKTYTFWHRLDGDPVRLILGPLDAIAEADLSEDERGRPPGTVLAATKDRILIAAGVGAVSPQGVQPAGKRLLPMAEFLRGYRVQAGQRFGGN